MTEDPGAVEALLRESAAPVRLPLLPELVLYEGRTLLGVWEAAEALLGAPTEAPFWAWHWPGGQGIARCLLDDPDAVRGRRVLDLACGGGVAAVAAARCGGDVLANDLDPLAVGAALANASLNGLKIEGRVGDLLSIPPEALGVEVVTVGDAFYSRPFAERLLPWLRAGRALGWDVWIGDGGRAFVPREGLAEVARFTLAVPEEIEGIPQRTARILRWP